MQMRAHVWRPAILPGPRASRAPPLSIQLARCPACGAPAIGAFCADCQERSRLHRDDDPYDDLGGED